MTKLTRPTTWEEKQAKLGYKKVVKLADYIIAYNSLTNFECDGKERTGNGNYGNLFKLAYNMGRKAGKIVTQIEFSKAIFLVVWCPEEAFNLREKKIVNLFVEKNSHLPTQTYC